MKPIAFDVETTTFEKGNPFAQRNKFVLGGCFDGTNYELFEDPSNYDFSNTGDIIYVGHNIKFDLNWLARCDVNTKNFNVWDTSIAHFLLTNQTTPFNSLNNVCDYYKLPNKIDVVKTEYWDKGIDTDAIPKDVLTEYLKKDLELTYKVFKLQLRDLKEKPNLYKLLRMQCKDLIVLHQMEVNGLVLNTSEALRKANELEVEIENTDNKIKVLYKMAVDSNAPVEWLNFGSPMDVGFLLYGGNRKHELRLPVGIYKTGLKKGQPRSRIEEQTYYFKTCVDTLHNAFNTDDNTLANLNAKGNIRKIITFIQERRKLAKLKQTYFEGIPKLIEKKDWKPNTIHGNFNQTRVVTGRLSSSTPNLQNFSPEFNEMLITRF